MTELIDRSMFNGRLGGLGLAMRSLQSNIRTTGFQFDRKTLILSSR